MRVCIISQTYVTQEPRVLRQIRTFQERGWAVTVAGLPGTLPVPPDWDFRDMTFVAPPAPTVAEVETVAPQEPPAPAAEPETPSEVPAEPPRSNHVLVRFPRKVFAFIYWRFLVPLQRVVQRLGQKLAKPLARSEAQAELAMPTPELEKVDEATRAYLLSMSLLDAPEPRAITFLEAKAIFYREPKNLHFRDVLAPDFPRADLVIAHDYHVLPLADEVARRSGAPIVFDIHEYAVEQYLLQPGTAAHHYFDHITRPMINAFHQHFFGQIRGASCVCNGIANQVAQDYDLPKAPTVVRSTPFFNEQPFRPVSASIEVMYHGLVGTSRHLEVGVRSLALWRPEFRFTIRGPGPADYIAGLRELARELGVSDRLSIEPPVPFDDLVSVANRADIGYLAFMNYSRQRQFASPNKFFEYIMAGLALAVMDVPELVPVVKANGNGILIPEFTPEAIADCINSFDAERINACKKASLALARELCWEKEQERMIAAYGLPELESQETRHAPRRPS